jgi:hypothetical protein
MNDIAGYAKATIPTTVPKIVPASHRRRLRSLPRPSEEAPINANGFSLNQASRQTAALQAFTRLSLRFARLVTAAIGATLKPALLRPSAVGVRTGSLNR